MIAMGNPSINLTSTGPTNDARVPNETNGILAYVGGDYIAAGSRQLPPAGEKEKAQPVRVVTLDVPGLGGVQITYELNTYSHRRSRHWHWRARRADAVPGGAA